MAEVINELKITGDVILEPVWEIKKFKYTYVLNGGDLPLNNNETVVHEWDSNGDLAKPTRNGYDFKGWYRSPNFEGNEIKKELNEDLMFYAKWEPKKYTINFLLGDTPSATPYFKYNSLSFTNENLPLTLGSPVADGYTFNGWHIISGSGTQDQIATINDMSDVNSFFGNAESINITAGWSVVNSTLTEEIYIQSNDPSNKTYELIKVNQLSLPTGSTYAPTSFIRNGFEEVTTEQTIKVSANGTVVKRYFDRKGYTATLECRDEYGVPEIKDKLYFKYSDNDIPLPLVKSNGRYHFVTWKDEQDRPVTHIPAYCSENRNYYAYFTQDKPVEWENFSITKSIIGYTIITKENNLQLLNKDFATENNNGNSFSFAIDTTYTNHDITSTQYAQLYFPAESAGASDGDRVYVEASEVVNVPIKFDRAKPTNFEATNEGITPLEDGIEIVELDGTTQDAPNGNKILLGEGISSLDFRFKENYMYNASEKVTVYLDGISEQEAPVINANQIKKSTYTTKGGVDLSNPYIIANLQYKEGISNEWQNVSSNGMLYLDDGDVYFRYKAYNTSGEGAKSYAASPVTKVTIEKKTVTVKFDVDGKPSNENVDNPELSPIDVKAGTQLSTNETYLKEVNSLTRFGYSMKMPRSTNFLAQSSDGSKPWNEANIITGNEGSPFTLYPQWIPNKKKYDAVTSIAFRNGEEDTLFECNGVELESTYGGKFTLKDVPGTSESAIGRLKSASKKAFLGYLESHEGYFPGSVVALRYSEDNGITWKNVSYTEDSILNDGQFNFSSTTEPNTVDREVFDYKFLPVFGMTNQSVHNNTTVSFQLVVGAEGYNCVATISGSNVYDAYKFNATTNTLELFKTSECLEAEGSLKGIEGNVIHLTLNGMSGLSINVIAHATYSLPKHTHTGAEVNKATYNGNDFYVVTGNSIEAANGWIMTEEGDAQ